MTLLKAQTVMTFLHAEGHEATFVVNDREPTNYHLRRMSIPRLLWEDFKKPEAITVTIEPGDKLNTEEDSDGAES